MLPKPISHLAALAVGAVVMALACLPASAEVGAWSTSAFRDPQNAAVVRAASVTNAEGYSASIFRSADRKVRWVLTLPSGSFDRLAKRGRIAAVRVDSLDAWDLSIEGYGTLEEATTDGTWVRDILWHGSDPTPTRGNLREILDGQTITARLFFDDGTRADTVFPLVGAPAAIGDALEIKVALDPAVAAKANAQADAIMTASTACLSIADGETCARVIYECSGEDIENMAIDAFLACIREARIPIE